VSGFTVFGFIHAACICVFRECSKILCHVLKWGKLTTEGVQTTG